MSTKTLIRVNERGNRIGESHPRAKLKDAEVERLIEDRGPSDAPKMSLKELALKYGISKSAVKWIVDGGRRAQIGPRIDAKATRYVRAKRVRVNLSVPLHIRAKLHRLGGGAWLTKIVEEAEA